MTVAEFSCEASDVANLFGCLFHSAVDVVSASDSDHSDSSKVIAVFRNDDGEVTGVCKSDFEFAARAAAALTMIPAGGCSDVIESGTLDDNYRENINEVMNLMATLISMPNSKRAFLAELIEGVENAPEDVVTVLDSPSYSSTLKATFTGYGDGVFSFYG